MGGKRAALGMRRLAGLEGLQSMRRPCSFRSLTCATVHMSYNIHVVYTHTSYVDAPWCSCLTPTPRTAVATLEVAWEAPLCEEDAAA